VSEGRIENSLYKLDFPLDAAGQCHSDTLALGMVQTLKERNYFMFHVEGSVLHFLLKAFLHVLSFRFCHR